MQRIVHRWVVFPGVSGRVLAGWFMVLFSLTACSSTPPSRLPDYLGPQAERAPGPLQLPPRPIHAGLVIVSDTSAPDAAPPPPDEAMHRLAERLQQEFNAGLPLVIEKILPAEGITPDGGVAQLTELGRKHGLDYLVLVVTSSTEQEYPLTIFLGWTSHSQPGLRRDNWSLIEAALIELKTGRTLLRAEGRGWATLDRPTAPGINQWYPVVWLRPQDPSRRYWPPSYAGAPNTLRVVAMDQAAKRLVLNFQETWIQHREAELESDRS
jgi:hypothetical protein